MTVSTTLAAEDFVGNGATTTFPCNFKVFDEDHLEVYLDGALQSLTTHYTVSGVGGDVTDVVFVTPPPNAKVVSVFRKVPLTQETDYLANDEFPAETHERALDLATMGLQQLDIEVRRSVRVPDSDPAGINMVLPTAAARANTLLGFGPAGAPTVVPLDEIPAGGIGGLPYITPEDHGAVGDGSIDDGPAFDLAIAAAVSTGKLLQGDPSKVYYIGTSLADVTGSVKIADCTFKAPNQVQLIKALPTWAAINNSLTGVTTTTIEGTTVTRVNLTSTVGLAVGDWVMVGSPNLHWPGETNVTWFEAAQIVALNTNTTIDLHRRLLGEEVQALTSALRLYKIPNYRVELRRLRFIADGNVLSAGQTGRRFAIDIRGGVGHIIEQCHAYSWWERFIRLRCAVKSQIISPSWDLLPDIPSSNEAFGYGVQETGACYDNLVFGMQGGRCRHGYTSGGVAVASFDEGTPWEYGFVALSVVKGGTVTGHSGVAFDTHAGTYAVTFDGLSAQDPVNQAGGVVLPAGFQSRGYMARIVNCTARGGDSGFRDGSALTNWAQGLDPTPAGLIVPNVAEYSNILVSDVDLEGMLIEGVDGNDNTVVVVDGLHVAGMPTGVHISSANPFDGKLFITDFRAVELTQNALLDDSGDADVQIVGYVGRYTGVSSPQSPIRVNVVGSGSWLLHDFTVLKATTAGPNGLINVQDASPAMPVTLGQVIWDLGATFPDLSPSSTGTLSKTEMNFRV